MRSTLRREHVRGEERAAVPREQLALKWAKRVARD
jgi:hypothetical protein